ncbi:CD48 antigen [Trichechus inunguis]
MCYRGKEWYLVLELLLLPQLFRVNSIQARSEHRVFAVTGSTMSLDVPKPGSYRQFAWIYLADSQKIVERIVNQQPTWFQPALQGRVHLENNGTLYIYRVQKNDSTQYLLQALETSGVEQESLFLLEVHDPVSKPVIKAEEKKEENNSCYLKLLCETLSKSVNYTWYVDSELSQQERQNAVFEIRLKPEYHPKSFTCKVSNPVSSQSDKVYFIPPCDVARSSGVAWIATWLVVMVPVVLSLLLP